MAKYITAPVALNEIGVPGQVGFGVGACDPANLLTGFTPMSGCYDKHVEECKAAISTSGKAAVGLVVKG